MGRSELKYLRNKAYSFNSTISVKEMQGRVKSGVMQFRRRIIQTQRQQNLRAKETKAELLLR